MLQGFNFTFLFLSLRQQQNGVSVRNTSNVSESKTLFFPPFCFCCLNLTGKSQSEFDTSELCRSLISFWWSCSNLLNGFSYKCQHSKKFLSPSQQGGNQTWPEAAGQGCAGQGFAGQAGMSRTGWNLQILGHSHTILQAGRETPEHGAQLPEQV